MRAPNTTPASFKRVVVARVCDAMEAWDLVASRVGSYGCPRHNRLRPFVSNEVTLALFVTVFDPPWHLNVTLLFRKVKSGGGLSWVDLAYNCSLAGYGRRSTAACVASR